LSSANIVLKALRKCPSQLSWNSSLVGTRQPLPGCIDGHS
jgi:hypothetical protein